MITQNQTPRRVQRKPRFRSRSAAAAMAIGGVLDLAQAIALNPRGPKLRDLRAVLELAEAVRELLPVLETAAVSFDGVIGRAALEALGALAVSSAAARESRKVRAA